MPSASGTSTATDKHALTSHCVIAWGTIETSTGDAPVAQRELEVAIARPVRKYAEHVDDENTLRVSWRNYPLPGERPFQQERIPYWYPRTKDPATGAWLTSRLENQDVIAMVGQGVIAERMEERLGESDRGVIMLRKRLLRDIELVANGSDPTGLIREPSKNRRLALPGTTRGQPDINEAEGPFAAELPRLWVEHTTPATDP